MYKLTLPLLGNRFKQIREYLGLSQIQLAEKLECKQSAISNLELGKGGSLKLVFNLLNFFSDYVYIDMIFNQHFYLISNDDKDARKNTYNSVIVEVIKQAESDFFNSLETKLDQAKEQLSIDLKKATDLLNS
ncbi:helix-turn-helix transcriptional regulator [Phocaeicola barnesiae]|jgi:transcriptional regulator with XRE-family HTH domain|uniref:helix-turn-helix transcriptional regulator n=1 Tax=Phocaeicola barnesiae TaxID=376804 RepID=UPI0025A3EC13|nr:helix-turn-helix transcriptional regulator [Phocaeicola barnesiae]MDM8242852.1 helix-turn-helix transcriptional regulator [Phocaeicola barnesiae]